MIRFTPKSDLTVRFKAGILAVLMAVCVGIGGMPEGGDLVLCFGNNGHFEVVTFDHGDESHETSPEFLHCDTVANGECLDIVFCQISSNVLTSKRIVTTPPSRVVGTPSFAACFAELRATASLPIDFQPIDVPSAVLACLRTIVILS